MTTHAPQAFAPYHAEEVTQLDIIEANFVRINGTYPEADEPIYERWLRILEYLPEVRGKHLWDDATEMMTDIYKNGSGNRLAAGVDYISLRLRFFEFLKSNKIGRAHVNDYEMQAAAVWMEKLLDRFDEVEPADVVDGTYVPAKGPDRIKHAWLH